MVKYYLYIPKYVIGRDRQTICRLIGEVDYSVGLVLDNYIPIRENMPIITYTKTAL